MLSLLLSEFMKLANDDVFIVFLLNINGSIKLSVAALKSHIKALLKNPDSMLNPTVKNLIDDPMMNYTKMVSKLNHKALEQSLEILEQDAIAQTWFMNEKLTDVIRPELRQSIELFMLTRQNNKTVENLTNQPPKFNEFRMRLASLKYVKIMDAISINKTPPHDTNYLHINGKYKPFSQCSSRAIRQTHKPRTTNCISRLDLNVDDISAHYRQIAKLRNTRFKNLILRLHHNDIFTKAKMASRGMTQEDSCDKCNL